MERAEKPYPYARPKTFEFLKSAIADGAHLELPVNLSEEQWVRDKNITTIYFSCEITKEELGQMYGVSRQAIDQVIDRTLERLRENSGAYTKAVYSGKLDSANPNSRQKFGLDRSSILRLRGHISDGLDDITIAEKTAISLGVVRQTMRDEGRRDLITSSVEVNRRLLKQLEELPPENYEERQRAMDQLKLYQYQHNPDLFVSIVAVAAIMGKKLHRRASDTNEFIEELNKNGIPTAVLKSGSVNKYGNELRYVIVHIRDFQSLWEKFSSSTNPS